MTSHEFFHKVETAGNAQPSSFIYLNSPLEDLDRSGQLHQDVSPWDQLVFPGAEANKDHDLTLFMGSPGVKSQLHYDLSHNAFVQLSGRKYFLLFPPESERLLYLYPRTHPHYRQSQVNTSATPEDISRFSPLFAYGRGMEVVLVPGDLLYIPPGWFHEVTSLDFAVSLSVWSDCPARVALSEVIALPLPLEESWNSKRRIDVSRMFVTMILDEILG
jgi:hypothetical protein